MLLFAVLVPARHGGLWVLHGEAVLAHEERAARVFDRPSGSRRVDVLGGCTQLPGAQSHALDEEIPLPELRTMKQFEGMAALRRFQRLSLQPVTPAHWKVICRRAKIKASIA